jgi:membrane protein implicated in regulation of membrane protease activity
MEWRRIWEVMSESFWILALALVALFVFLLALGAYSPGEVLTLTIVMVLLFAAWLGHAVWLSRRRTGRDPRSIAAREFYTEVVTVYQDA